MSQKFDIIPVGPVPLTATCVYCDKNLYPFLDSVTTSEIPCHSRFSKRNFYSAKSSLIDKPEVV